MNASEIFNELNTAIENAFDVPNALLPVDMHSKNGYRKLGSVRRIAKIKSDKMSQHQLDKQAKAARIAAYSVQAELEQEISYIEDPDRVYKMQLAFCKVMISAGLMEDDFE